MIDFTTIFLAILAAYGYRLIVNKQLQRAPDVAQGPTDHSRMPETKYIQPLEASEFDASHFTNASNGFQQGSFGLPVISF